MSQLLSQPPLRAKIADNDGLLPSDPFGWVAWFHKIQILLSATVQSGTTAERPTTGLYVGRIFFDESLGTAGKPIFRDKNNTGWVDAAGSAV